jgi:hypothetical protein
LRIVARAVRGTRQAWRCGIGCLHILQIRHGGTWHPAVPDRDPFGAQPPRLLPMLTGATREYDAAAGAHDAMPRNMQRRGRDPQGKSSLARASGQAGRAGHLSIA